MTLLETIKLFFCFFFRKEKFVQFELDRIIKENLASNRVFKEQYPNKGSIPQEYINDWTTSSEKRMSALRSAIYSSFLFSSFILLLCAILAAVFFSNNWPPESSTNFGLLSTYLILWATYGQLGWEIQTVDGTSYAEKINLYWFRIVFGCGMFLLFMALFMS